MKPFRIILRYSINSFEQALSNIPIFLVFLLGKLIRYGMFISFLYFLFNGLSSVGGYNRGQILLFFIVFNLIDTLGQLLFREVYRFRPLVISGGFDLVLTKPMSPLVRALLGGPDLMDVGMLLIIIGACIYVVRVYFHPSVFDLLIFAMMIINSLIITTAFHVFVLGMGIITFSVDHLIMIYRDLTSLMRIPVDLFTDPLRSFLTFIIPIGIMFTFPAKALFGLLSWKFILMSFAFGGSSLFLALKFWNYSLRQYQSASS